jgi:hypothetical protein
MPISSDIKSLTNTSFLNVEKPDYVCLTYAVCRIGKESCGWGGWIIEAAFKINKNKRSNTVTGDKLVLSDSTQRCPVCGKMLFRTDVSGKYDYSLDQPFPLPPKRYVRKSKKLK